MIKSKLGFIYIILIIVIVFGILLIWYLFNDKKKSVSIKEHGITLYDIKEKVVLEGDTNAYDQLYHFYIDRESFEEILPYALIMSNKYHYSQAYYDVYFALEYLISNFKDVEYPLDYLDDKNRTMAIEYLKLSIEKGHSVAKDELGKFYIEGKYVPKNVELGEKLIKEYNDILVKDAEKRIKESKKN